MGPGHFGRDFGSMSSPPKRYVHVDVIAAEGMPAGAERQPFAEEADGDVVAAEAPGSRQGAGELVAARAQRYLPGGRSRSL
jgi:hypothetical protein